MSLICFRVPRTLHRSLLLLSLCACLSCTREQASIFPHDRPSHGEFMIMSYNLKIYGYFDRDDDGQPDDFKPEKEIAPLVAIVETCQPDVLAVQEIGSPNALLDLKERLKTKGVDYPHIDYVGSDGSFANLAIFSKYPITGSHPVTNLSYTIKGAKYPVLRGFQQVEIEFSPAFTVTLINAHLKSKRYHPAGQTEMRRSESRLLATHVRHLQRSHPEQNIIVCGDFNDDVRSSSMRELLDDGATELSDLLLQDPNGQIWTHFYRYGQVYSRIDYMLVSEPMLDHYVEGKSGIVKSTLTGYASDHRPIYATFSQQGLQREKHADGNTESR